MTVEKKFTVELSKEQMSFIVDLCQRKADDSRKEMKMAEMCVNAFAHHVFQNSSESVMETDEDGNKYWKLDGELHREDGPAVEYANGTTFWFKNGKRHREDGPAVEFADGTKHWYLNGKLHREDGPAVEYANGYKAWFKNGQRISG